jgi:hypothetical protein
MANFAIERRSSTDIVKSSAVKLIVKMAIGLVIVSVAFVFLLTVILLATGGVDNALQVYPQ